MILAYNKKMSTPIPDFFRQPLLRKFHYGRRWGAEQFNKFQISNSRLKSMLTTPYSQSGRVKQPAIHVAL
jgi:hypothetical protein